MMRHPLRLSCFRQLLKTHARAPHTHTLPPRRPTRTKPAWLVEGQLKLTLHSSLAGLGSLYAVLSKRRGRVLSYTMLDGTDLIRITAALHQAESFCLSPELPKKSSSEVTAPELVFSHWQVLDVDPFWIPTS